VACVFCDIAEGKIPAHLVFEDDLALAFLDKTPLFHGHVLVVPRAHVVTLPVVSQSVAHLHVHVVPRTKGDGLKGFFWPRTKYSSDDQMRETADRIRPHVAI